MNKGQFLIEVVLALGFLVVILGILISFTGLLQRSIKYQDFYQTIALAGFEKYRNVLISLTQENWNKINSLLPNTNYYLYSSGNEWYIGYGEETINTGKESFSISFKLSDYYSNEVKFVTVTAKYLNLVLEDYFLLPKLNVE